mgnify:CR=1 FL=1
MEKLSKQYKLLSKNDFSGLFGTKKIKKTNIIYSYVKSNNYNISRVGISVSRKVGNAVYRNLVKRLIRETFRKSPVKLNGYDILFVACPVKSKNGHLIEINNQSLRNAISNLLLEISYL